MKLGRLLAARPGLVGALFKHIVSRSMVGGRPRVPACPGRRRTDQSFRSVLSRFSCVQLFVIPWIPPGSSVHGILQATMLEWAVISFPRGSSRPRDQTCVSYISALADRFFITSATWETFSGWGGV